MSIAVNDKMNKIMARDYAKKPKSPARKRANATRRKKTGFPTVAVLMVGMIVGGFIAFLAYLKFLPSSEQSKVTTTASAKDTGKNTGKKAEESKTSPPQPETKVPKYTFYDLLEDKQVIIPEEELKRPENTVSMQYIMPCASFTQQENAEALKAKIALLGFESKIQPVKWNDKQLYRVQLGPFASKRQAESIRHRLQENDINDCKIWGRKL
jgi:cell division protein FtsN